MSSVSKRLSWISYLSSSLAAREQPSDDVISTTHVGDMDDRFDTWALPQSAQPQPHRMELPIYAHQQNIDHVLLGNWSDVSGPQTQAIWHVQSPCEEHVFLLGQIMRMALMAEFPSSLGDDDENDDENDDDDDDDDDDGNQGDSIQLSTKLIHIQHAHHRISGAAFVFDGYRYAQYHHGSSMTRQRTCLCFISIASSSSSQSSFSLDIDRFTLLEHHMPWLMHRIRAVQMHFPVTLDLLSDLAIRLINDALLDMLTSLDQASLCQPSPQSTIPETRSDLSLTVLSELYKDLFPKDFLARCVTSHLQTAGRAILMGKNATLINILLRSLLAIHAPYPKWVRLAANDSDGPPFHPHLWVQGIVLASAWTDLDLYRLFQSPWPTTLIHVDALLVHQTPALLPDYLSFQHRLLASLADHELSLHLAGSHRHHPQNPHPPSSSSSMPPSIPALIPVTESSRLVIQLLKSMYCSPAGLAGTILAASLSQLRAQARVILAFIRAEASLKHSSQHHHQNHHMHGSHTVASNSHLKPPAPATHSNTHHHQQHQQQQTSPASSTGTTTRPGSSRTAPHLDSEQEGQHIHAHSSPSLLAHAHRPHPHPHTTTSSTTLENSAPVEGPIPAAAADPVGTSRQTNSTRRGRTVGAFLQTLWAPLTHLKLGFSGLGLGGLGLGGLGGGRSGRKRGSGSLEAVVPAMMHLVLPAQCHAGHAGHGMGGDGALDVGSSMSFGAGSAGAPAAAAGIGSSGGAGGGGGLMSRARSASSLSVMGSAMMHSLHHSHAHAHSNFNTSTTHHHHQSTSNVRVLKNVTTQSELVYLVDNHAVLPIATTTTTNTTNTTSMNTVMVSPESPHPITHTCVSTVTETVPSPPPSLFSTGMSLSLSMTPLSTSMTPSTHVPTSASVPVSVSVVDDPRMSLKVPNGWQSTLKNALVQFHTQVQSSGSGTSSGSSGVTGGLLTYCKVREFMANNNSTSGSGSGGSTVMLGNHNTTCTPPNPTVTFPPTHANTNGKSSMTILRTLSGGRQNNNNNIISTGASTSMSGSGMKSQTAPSSPTSTYSFVGPKTPPSLRHGYEGTLSTPKERESHSGGASGGASGGGASGGGGSSKERNVSEWVRYQLTQPDVVVMLSMAEMEARGSGITRTLFHVLFH